MDCARAVAPTSASHVRHAWRSHGSSSTGQQQLVCFIASHVATEARARALTRTLQSISKQSTSIAVAISWSAEPPLAARVCEALEKAAFGLHIQAFVQSAERLSQFEHLRRLAEAHAVQPPAWVLFSDDDDLWSEGRAAFYARACSDASFVVRSVLCRRKAMPRHGRTQGPPPTDAQSVRDLLSSGAARLTDADLPDGIADEEHNMAECASRLPFRPFPVHGLFRCESRPAAQVF